VNEEDCGAHVLDCEIRQEWDFACEIECTIMKQINRQSCHLAALDLVNHVKQDDLQSQLRHHACTNPVDRISMEYADAKRLTNLIGTAHPLNFKSYDARRHDIETGFFEIRRTLSCDAASESGVSA
jgi:hypothetical protein